MNWDLENAYGHPHQAVAGVDEAGRGCWAGPVVAAAIILPPDFPIATLNDSKKLTARQRENVFAHLQALPHGIGLADVGEIDSMNILQASLLAMKRAVAQLARPPAHILVDGNRLPDWHIPATAIIKGDTRSPSIMAASIIAKVSRDQIMVNLAEQYPAYDWARNKGYGAPAHQAGLAAQGVSVHHRRSYAPIRHILTANA